MINNIFNRTIFLWAGAIVIALFIVDSHNALVQRINTMNESRISCLVEENCASKSDLTEAREYYTILAQLYPGYGRGFEMEGICHLLLKEDNLAIKDFQEAIKHNPNLFWVSFELGKVFYRQGHYAQALRYFQGIIAQDNITLLKKSALSNLHRFPDQTKEALMYSLIDFVNEIKLQSYQMAVGCLIHQGDLAQAKSIINSELNSQEFRQNEFFISAGNSMDQEASRKEMLSWIDAFALAKPVLHPWSHVIPPVKEILYQ